MSEISEIEIISMTKEQNYMRGYFDGKQDILDKIKSEMEQLTSRYSISKERGGMGQVEWSDRLIKESDVLQIIDKYRGEADSRECKAEHDCYECKKYEEREVEE